MLEGSKEGQEPVKCMSPSVFVKPQEYGADHSPGPKPEQGVAPKKGILIGPLQVTWESSGFIQPTDCQPHIRVRWQNLTVAPAFTHSFLSFTCFCLFALGLWITVHYIFVHPSICIVSITARRSRESSLDIQGIFRAYAEWCSVLTAKPTFKDHMSPRLIKTF